MTDETTDISMFYMKQPVKRWTFEQPKLRKWLEGEIQREVEDFLTTEQTRSYMILNAFAGKVRLSIPNGSFVSRVDSSDEFDPDYHMDIDEFIKGAKKMSIKYDFIILDPPYNLRKSREKYGDNYIGSFTKIKNELIHILHDNGVIVSFGYDTTGMSESRGFKKFVVGMVCHSGDHNDTLVVAERLENRAKGLKYCEKKAIYNE